MARTVHLAAAAVLALAGCTSTDISLDAVITGTPEGQALSFAASGRAFVYGRRVDLPRAQEDQRWGVVLVDVTPLPPAWRPDQARQGGLIVAAVDAASPLAQAGLRANDLLLALDGEPAVDAAKVEEALREAESLTLHVAHHDGERVTIEATAADPVHGGSSLDLVGLVSFSGSATGAAVRVGPLGALFGWRRTLGWGAAPEGGLGPWFEAVEGMTEGYSTRLEWSTLFGLVRWESETWRGQERSRLHLLWLLPLGSDEFVRSAAEEPACAPTW